MSWNDKPRRGRARVEGAAEIASHTYGSACLLGVGILVAGLALAKAAFRLYDTDEFHTFYGASFAHAFDDLPNNPPLFNLLAATLRVLLPGSVVFLLPVLPALLAIRIVARWGRELGLSGYSLAAALACFARAWIDLASYFRAFSLVSLFLLLAFDAWQRSAPRRFVGFTVLASLSHHLGWFASGLLFALSWFIAPTLPLSTLLALLPDGAIIAWGSLGKLAERDTWGMPVLTVASLPVLQVFAAVAALWRGGVSAPAAPLSVWLLGLYALLVALSCAIPFREPYLWILLPPATLLWASLFQRGIAWPSRWGRRLACLTIVFLAGLGIVGAGLHLQGHLAAGRAMRSVESELRAQLMGNGKVFLYPNGDLLWVHYTLEGLAPVPSYSINMRYDRLGPLFREAPAPSSTALPPRADLERFRSPSQAILDVAPLRQPFVVVGAYDMLILRRDYTDWGQVPADYEQTGAAGEFLLFTPRGATSRQPPS